jgi:AraC-like DNA-binding protein
MKEYYSVARLENGRSQWWAQGKLWSGQAGSIQLKQPGDVHRDVAHDGLVTFQVVLLSESDFEHIRDEGKIVAHPHLEPTDERARAFHRLHDAVAAGADRLSLEVAVTEAVAAYAQLKSIASHHTRPVRRTIEYLREHLTDVNTLDELALHAGLDKFHLCRAFRAQVGMPPHAYLTHLRIARAKQLLEKGVRASEVAHQVGLYDQSQLNRHFRRILGTTPGRHAGRESR